jgi:hypothetical protein
VAAEKPEDPVTDSTLDTAHLVELGRMTVAAAAIEYHMAGIAAALVSPDTTEVGHLVVRRVSFSQLAEMSLKILPNRLTDDSPAAALAQPITAWIASAQKVMQWRNRLLHAVWMIYAPQQTATVLRRNGETEDIPIAKLQGYVEEGEEVARRGGELWEDLIYRYGHLDALIEATRAMDPEWWDAQGRESPD